ncbi:hypothetical protein DFJ63DRAFT_313945 [Scheffersomyces coipomensis]|uniref:uncharacterized protein n=1 Tax=Scheffersomyces coipomensis TaxID=1788519 RepID=UPI00315C7581
MNTSYNSYSNNLKPLNGLFNQQQRFNPTQPLQHTNGLHSSVGINPLATQLPSSSQSISQQKIPNLPALPSLKEKISQQDLLKQRLVQENSLNIKRLHDNALLLKKMKEKQEQEIDQIRKNDELKVQQREENAKLPFHLNIYNDRPSKRSQKRSKRKHERRRRKELQMEELLDELYHINNLFKTQTKEIIDSFQTQMKDINNKLETMNSRLNNTDYKLEDIHDNDMFNSSSTDEFIDEL